MKRDTLIVAAISLVSVLAGSLIYRYTFFEPQYVSAKPALVEDSGSHPVDTVSYDEIVLNDLNNKPRHLEDWKQPVQVINFWAPWCAPCRREIPALVDMQNTYQGSIQLIGLSFDSPENVIDFKNKYPINYPLLLVQHEATQINQYFGNNSSALPFTVILNRDREIVFRHAGEISGELLEQEIKALL